MKLSNAKRTQYKDILFAHALTNRDNVYNDIIVELERLWSIEHDVTNLFEPYPFDNDHSGNYRPKNLQQKIEDRKILTKKIMEALK